MTYSGKELVRLKTDAGIPHLPTQLTAEMRMAISGEGPRAYDWSDKPHRLVYDLCSAIEQRAQEETDTDILLSILLQTIKARPDQTLKEFAAVFAPELIKVSAS